MRDIPEGHEPEQKRPSLYIFKPDMDLRGKLDPKVPMAIPAARFPGDIAVSIYCDQGPRHQEYGRYIIGSFAYTPDREVEHADWYQPNWEPVKHNYQRNWDRYGGLDNQGIGYKFVINGEVVNKAFHDRFSVPFQFSPVGVWWSGRDYVDVRPRRETKGLPTRVRPYAGIGALLKVYYTFNRCHCGRWNPDLDADLVQHVLDKVSQEGVRELSYSALEAATKLGHREALEAIRRAEREHSRTV